MAINKFFTANTLEDLKKEYRKLAKKFHPDLNQTVEATKIFVAIQDEYERLFAILKGQDKKAYQHKESATDTSYRDIIDILVQYVDINIEIVGSWIWVSGNTYGIKTVLKEMGFKWSKSNKKWYFGETVGKKKGAMSWNKKVELFGVDTVQTAEKEEKILIAKKR